MKHTGLDRIREKLDQYDALRVNRIRLLLDTAGRPEQEVFEGVRQRMDANKQLSFEERGCAHIPLTQTDTQLLEVMCELYVQEQGRLQILSQDPFVRDRLVTLLAHGVAQQEQLDHLEDMVEPEDFRSAMIGLFGEMFVQVLKKDELMRENIICFAPWRAGLAGAIGLHTRGVRHFAHIGSSRNEKTLETNEPYMFRWTTPVTADSHVYITDPMLAGGATAQEAIEITLEQGVSEDRIRLLCAVAAPEGVDTILSQYSKVRISAAIVSKGLDKNGYIEYPRLGDAGDMFFKGWTRERAASWLVFTGILSQEELDLVFKKTASKTH